jgi:peptidoglycan DL-endopeptidase CwlO
MKFASHTTFTPGSRRRPARLAAARRAAALATCSLLACLVAALAAGAAAATPVTNLGTLQAQAARVRTEVNRLDRRAEIAVEKYDTSRAQLDQLNVQLMQTRMDLERAQAQLDAAREAYGQRMADMYKSSDLSVLDVLFSASDFADLGTSIDYYRKISDADMQIIQRVQTLTRSVAQLASQLDQERAQALTKEMDLRTKQADVEDQLAARKALLASLNAQVKKLIAQQARLNAAASRRLAKVAGANIGTIHGTAVQIAVVKETMKYLGIPYVWGGATPSGGFDCSGLVLYVYAKFGVNFPHGATMQAHMGTPVPFSQLQPADLVFFGYPAFYHHVGIYIGNGLFIEAPHTGDVVKVSVLAGRGAALACRYPIHLP